MVVSLMVILIPWDRIRKKSPTQQIQVWWLAQDLDAKEITSTL